MKVIVTAGPTREYIDTVRFITNASSGKMGYACAAAAAAAGHEVTLITGPVALEVPAGVEVVRITTVKQLQQALERRFDSCDALVMTAAVGDFTVRSPSATKIPRSAAPFQVTLAPTEDVLARLGGRKRPRQVVVGFAVEDTAGEQKAYDEMLAKNCDYVVLNPPAAMGADESEACILSRDGVVLEWGRRSKRALAGEIVALLK